MVKTVIPIHKEASRSPLPLIPTTLSAAHGRTLDRRQRPLRDLRISVTDRCNFRCTYCMPKEVFDQHYPYLAQSELLSFEEIHRLAKIFASLGVEKIRLTGGEPLLRKNLETLISMLAKIRTPQNEALDLTLTTNGSLLSKKSVPLKESGLQRLTVSLDALDDAIFKAMNDVDYPVSDVLKGIEAAQKAGFEGIKVNMVVKKGVNDHEILPMAKYFRNSGITLRFIEFMDVGSSNGWNLDQVLPSAKVIAMISEHFPLEQVDPNYAGEVAQRWRYQDGAGEIGVISSVTQAFCHECTRARLSTDGQLFLCLFATEGFDFKTLMRSGRSDLEIANAVMQTWSNREDRYSEIRHLHTKDLERKQRKVEMSYIGGKGISMIVRSDVTGLLLAGGRAQRMGGIDKGLIPFLGKPLIEHAIHRLGPQVSNLVINANRNQDIYSQYGYPIVADQNQDFAGPLAGYLAGLKVCNTPHLMTAPCDSPLFPTDLVMVLAEALETQKANIAYASSQDSAGTVWAQPVFCLMKREVLHSLEHFLADGERKIDRWFASQNACTAIFANESAFANANTPEELAQLEKLTP